jgi:hypothetical protein
LVGRICLQGNTGITVIFKGDPALAPGPSIVVAAEDILAAYDQHVSVVGGEQAANDIAADLASFDFLNILPDQQPTVLHDVAAEIIERSDCDADV